MMKETESNDRDMNFAENFVIISSRKTDFTTTFVKKLKAENEENILPKVINEIVKIVASLDPSLFVSSKELKEGHIYLETKLEDINREKIGEEIAKRMENDVE